MPTKIAYADESWNLNSGCTRAGDGCKNCYAERFALRMMYHSNPKIHAKYNPVVFVDEYMNGWSETYLFHETELLKPLHWKKPRIIFVDSMSDIFHEKQTDENLDKIFAVMALAPQHRYLLLTKRPERMRDYWNQLRNWKRNIKDATYRIIRSTRGLNMVDAAHEKGWHYVWCGVSVWDQASADRNIPILLNTPAAHRFISAEPLLGEIDLSKWMMPVVCVGIHWMIVGGETGPGARPCNVEDIDVILNQCQTADVPVFLKQFGDNPKTEGNTAIICMNEDDAGRQFPPELEAIRKGKQS
jgi:protein gp37